MKTSILYIIFTFMLSGSGFSQYGNLTGTITNPQGELEFDVLITLDGVNKCRSDLDGNFKLDSIPYGDHVLGIWTWDHSFTETDTTKISLRIKSDTSIVVQVEYRECEYQRDSDVCPICHKKDEVIPIIYGYPSKRLIKQSNKGKAKIGGCVVSYCDPHWFCKRDDSEF